MRRKLIDTVFYRTLLVCFRFGQRMLKSIPRRVFRTDVRSVGLSVYIGLDSDTQKKQIEILVIRWSIRRRFSFQCVSASLKTSGMPRDSGRNAFDTISSLVGLLLYVVHVYGGAVHFGRELVFRILSDAALGTSWLLAARRFLSGIVSSAERGSVSVG